MICGAWPSCPACPAFRRAALAVVVFSGLFVLLLIRLVEKPVHGLHRPWTPWITQGVCRTAFWEYNETLRRSYRIAA